MLQLEILICKLLAVDGLAASAVASREVTTLKHESLDDAVEGAAFVGEGWAGFAVAFFACAEGAEVFDGFRDDIVVEFEGDATSGSVVD